MKVLEDGKWKNPWSLEVVCSEKECGAKLLVAESDVKAKDYSHLYCVCCPICESNVFVSGNLIPLRVKKPIDKNLKTRTTGELSTHTTLFVLHAVK